MRISKALLIAGMSAAVALAATGTADARRAASITVYQEDDYGGDYRTITDDIENLDWEHFDDRISSVDVRRGRWLLCEHSHYRGRCITVDGAIPRLDRLGFDDRISSIRRLR